MASWLLDAGRYRRSTHVLFRPAARSTRKGRVWFPTNEAANPNRPRFYRHGTRRLAKASRHRARRRWLAKPAGPVIRSDANGVRTMNLVLALAILLATAGAVYAACAFC